MKAPSKIERETIMIFNEAEAEAEVSTCNTVLLKKLRSWSEKNAQIRQIKPCDRYGETYLVPKAWIKIKQPPRFSTEQKQRMAEQLKRNRKGEQYGEVDL